MDQLFTEQVLRMFERHMVVLGGIIAIVLGYRLFQSADLKQDSTGSMKTKLFEVSATKIGPGVFFAAFGTVVLWTSLTRGSIHTRPVPNAGWWSVKKSSHSCKTWQDGSSGQRTVSCFD